MNWKAITKILIALIKKIPDKCRCKCCESECQRETTFSVDLNELQSPKPPIYRRYSF
jgi:hypothetical protein